MTDTTTATERHLERLTTVPGLVCHLLLADWTEDEGLDLPAPEPQPDEWYDPDGDMGPWDLHAWLCRRVGTADGNHVWQAALRWYDAVMAGADAPTTGAGLDDPEPTVDPVSGIPGGATIRVWSGAGERPLKATDWSTTEAGVLLTPIDTMEWSVDPARPRRRTFVPWTQVKVIEVGD